jgi:chromosome partitioning protein
MKIISIANQKGGSGKTTLAVNISATLARKGLKTLLIDLDPQSNSTMSLIEPMKINSKNSIGALLCDEIKVQDSIHQSGYLSHLDFIPATLDLSITELDLGRMPTGGILLRQKLEELGSDKYDYVICDCPPNFGVMTTNAVHASGMLMVPMEPETFAYYGLEMFMTSLVPRMRKYVNKNLRLLGIVLNRVNTARILTQTVRQELQRRYPDFLFRTEIPIDVRLPESASAHLPVCVFAKSSRSAQAIDLLTDEFIERIGKIEQK